MAFPLGNGVAQYVEPKTGLALPTTLGNKVLVVTGLNNVKFLGLKTITVYTFGIYADRASVKSAFGGLSVEERKKDSQIDKFRGGLEEDMKESLKKFGKNDESKLLKTFANAYSSDLKLHKGSEMITTRLPSYTLKSYFEGKEVGSLQSALLSRAWAEIYFGSDPVDKAAKAKTAEYLARILQS